jgi:hypothetical protein
MGGQKMDAFIVPLKNYNILKLKEKNGAEGRT